MALDFSQFQPRQEKKTMSFFGNNTHQVPNYALSPRFAMPSTSQQQPIKTKKPRQPRQPRKQQQPQEPVNTTDEDDIAPAPIQKPIRKRTTTTTEPVVRKRAERKRKQTDKEIVTNETCAMESLAAEERILNQVQETVTQYGPTGLKLIETTTTRHEEKTSKQETWRMNWNRVRTEREHTFKLIENYTIEECKQKSHGFLFFERSVRRELQTFKQKVKLYLDNDMSRAWTDTDFVSRFLFGLPNNWEESAQLEYDEIPWLACLWSMKDMLELCNDASWVDYFCTHRANSEHYNLNSLPQKLLCINQRTMCGFVTGQLLAHTIPELSAVMRKHVREDVQQMHFPTFSEYIVDNFDPPILLLEYDFHNVDAELPSGNAHNCAPSNTCCVLGIEPDKFFETSNTEDTKHVFCDATFLRLLGSSSIYGEAMRTAKRFACEIQPNKQRHTVDEAFDSIS